MAKTLNPGGSSTFSDDTLFSYVRIYADPQGESHFEDVEVDLPLNGNFSSILQA